MEFSMNCVPCLQLVSREAEKIESLKTQVYPYWDVVLSDKSYWCFVMESKKRYYVVIGIRFTVMDCLENISQAVLFFFKSIFMGFF